MSLCIDDRLVCRCTYTPNGHLYRVTYTRCRIDTINSPDDGHMAARNMQRIEINIHKKRIVRQVGYLQRLYRDARSTEHKIHFTQFLMKIILEQYTTAIVLDVVHGRSICVTVYMTFWEVSRHPPLGHIQFLLADIFDFRLITTVRIKMDTILISEQNSNYWSGKYWTLSDIILAQRTKRYHKF